MIDVHYFDGHWAYKSPIIFYVDFACDIIRLTLLIFFFVFISSIYCLPLHMTRDIGVTISSLRERVVKFIHYLRVTRNMEVRFPDVPLEEMMAREDRVCIVCLDEMMHGAKKLPCGHMFHLTCLRSWFERDHRCPTCRHPASEPAPVPVRPTAPDQQPAFPIQNNVGPDPLQVPTNPPDVSAADQASTVQNPGAPESNTHSASTQFDTQEEKKMSQNENSSSPLAGSSFCRTSSNKLLISMYRSLLPKVIERNSSSNSLLTPEEYDSLESSLAEYTLGLEVESSQLLRRLSKLREEHSQALELQRELLQLQFRP